MQKGLTPLTLHFQNIMKSGDNMSRVYYYGALREVIGKKEDTFDTKDIKSCLRHIKTVYGTEAYKEAKRSLITLNGISILSMDNFKTRTGPDDEIRFLPICGGG